VPTDDVTLSGVHATRALLYRAKARIQQCGLPTHKEKYVAPGRAGVVTGVAIEDGQLHLRNKQHQAIVEIIDAIRAGDATLTKSLNGKLTAAAAVEPAAAAGPVERYMRRIVHTDQQQT